MTAEDIKFAIVTLSAVFFVVDPLVAVPIFLSITQGDSLEKKKAAAARAAAAAFVTLCSFAALGALIFQLFGISLGAFKVAGGLMLFLMAVDMMRAQPSRTRSSEEEQRESLDKEDVAIVPMAIPMLAGPGAIATVMVFMSRAAWRPIPTIIVFGAVTVTCLATWLLLRWGAVAERFMKRTVLHVVERVMGLLLSAIAVEFVVSGVKELLPILATS